MLDPVLSWITALCIATLFGSAAAHKLMDWHGFLGVIRNYRLLPSPLLLPAALLVVTLECAAVLALLLPSSRVGGSLLTACLLGTYSAAIGINLRRGRRNIDCGCLGAGRRQRMTGWLVARNLGLAAMAMVAGLPKTSRILGALDVVTITCTVTTMAVLYVIFSTLSGVAASRVGVRP